MLSAKFLSLSGPQLPHRQNQCDNCICLIGFWLGLKELRILRYARELGTFPCKREGFKNVAWPPMPVSLGSLCCTILRVALVFPQVWNQTETEPAADRLLSLCFLKTAGVWVPPMYLWVLGPIYLLYINHHGTGYIQMSPLFKAKMVATASGSLEPDNGWGGAGGRGRLEPGRNLRVDTPVEGRIGQGQGWSLLINQSNPPEATEVNAVEQGSPKQIW